MDMSASTKELLGDVAGVGAGVLAWMKTSTANMDESQRSFSQQFEDALANLIGKNAMVALDSSYNGAGDLTPKVFGFLNKTTIVGAGVLVVDAIAQGFPQYKKLDGLHDIVEKVGWGVTLGGAIGGVFDPAKSGGYTTPPSVPGSGGSPQSGGVATGNVPYARAGIGAHSSVVN